MANVFEIAFLMPLKVYPVKTSPGKNFDDDWFYKRLKDWQFKRDYKQKIEKTDILKVQVRSTYADPTYTLYSVQGYPVTSPVAGTFIRNDTDGAGIYEFNLVFLSIDPGVYSGYFKSELSGSVFAFLTEPWHVAVTHPNTSVIRYKNSLNDFGVMFTGRDQDDNPYTPEFSFRGEFDVMDLQPDRDRSSYRDQVLNQSTLYAMPFRQFKFHVGDARGVAEWVMDLLNRIICCDEWYINDLQFETPDGAKWEVNRQQGYPLIGASIDVVPAKNLSGLQQNDTEVPGGIFAAYDLETQQFGTLNAPPDENEVIVENVE